MEIMSMVWGILILLSWAVVACIGCVYAYGWARAYKLESEARALLSEYKARCNGSNRFIFNEDVFQQSFPEHSMWARRKVWNRLVTTRAIERDPLDGEWSIR